MNQKRSFAFGLKSITTAGQFTGRASVYGVVDAHNDVVMPGAFDRSLTELRGRIVVLNQHDPSDPIGEAQLESKSDGLHAVGQLILELQSAKEMHVRMKHGLIDGISIGYEVIDHTWAGEVRQLKEIKLWEISLVTFPANQFARVTDVKHNQDDACAALARTARESAAWAKRHRQKHMNPLEILLDNLRTEIQR